jgi:hypothetical protein
VRVPTDYLVAYDYGQGGVWAIVEAESVAAITAMYPEPQVVEDRPVWLNDERYERLPRLTLDREPTGLLRSILDGRSDS